MINGIGGGVGVIAAQLARDREVAVFGVRSEAKRDITVDTFEASKCA